jgi:hypothetical protein
MSKREDIKMKALDRIARGWNTANIPAKDLLDLICENEYLERRNDELIAANRELQDDCK